MRIVGIYGGIGSGKTSVARMIKELGGYVLSADEENRALLEEDNYISKLRAIFPAAFDGDRFNKAKLRDIIFNDSESLKMLNDLSHPCIIARLKEKLKEPITFIELPVYVKDIEADINVVVVTTVDNQCNRVSTRDGRSVGEVKKIIDAQNYLCKIPNPVYIENNSSTEELYYKVKTLYEKILKDYLDNC